MRNLVASIVAFGFLVAGCGHSPSNEPVPAEIDEVVRTAAAPVDWMARTIAGGLVPVEMLVPADQLPAVWRPEPDVINRFQRARLIVLNGATFESWARGSSLPQSRVLRSADGIEGELLIVAGETHSHGPEGEHAHDVIDGHTWVDPMNAVAQASLIGRAMSTAFPEHEAAFSENLASLQAELGAQHERLADLDTSIVAVIASESPYGYIARRYGWPTGEIGGEPAAWASELDAMGLGSVLGDRSRAVLLCEALPDSAVAAALLESHGVRAVLWDTGELAGGASYAEVLAGNVDRLAAAIEDLAG